MFAQLLNESEIARVHDASLDILENVGLLVRNLRAQEIFRAHGLTLNENEIVKFPSSVIERALKTIPPTFTFFAREEKYDRTLPTHRPVIMTASSAPNLLDPVTQTERRAYSGDIARIARLNLK